MLLDAGPVAAAWAGAAARPASAPTGVPQRWQNLAPGVSSAEQLPQVTPSIAAPHSAQYFPAEGWPQLGQGDDVAGELAGDMPGR